MDHPAFILIHEVQTHHPDTYNQILHIIKPHKIESLARLLKDHLNNANGLDLDLFNRYRDKIPHFLLRFTQCVSKKFPNPGDAFGIQLTCRITKTDTQDILDSRHLKERSISREYSLFPQNYYKNEYYKALKYELELFSAQSQILEISGRRRYSSIYVRGYSVEQLLSIFRFASCVLTKNMIIPLNILRFIIVPSIEDGIHRIVYSSHARDLTYLMKHLDLEKIVAFNDVKYIYQKCGISCYFLNMVKVIRLVKNDYDDRHLRDLLNVVKYQCRTGEPLPLNRDGLAKNPVRSPLEVLSFEAPKKNYVRLSTLPQNEQNYKVTTSTDKMFFGQQFNEGTGFNFSILPNL